MYITTGLPKVDESGNRLFFACAIYVSRDGKTLYNLQDKTSYPHYYSPHPDTNGRLYITNRGNRYYVDEMVATCYCYKPAGKRCTVYHKDGDITNNHASNLEWKIVQPVPYTLNTDSSCKIGNLKVMRDGTVYEGRNKLTVQDHLYDPDMDLFITIRPHVNYNNKHVFMDDLVTKARFVQEDRDKLIDPVILHIDNDPLNYSRDNLKWVERNSNEYQAYQIEYSKWEYNNNIKINPYKHFPDFKQPKI